MIAHLRRRAQLAASARVVAHLRATHQRVYPRPEQGLFNQRCHDNVAEWCRVHPGHGCTEVVQVEPDGDPALHYVARDPEGALLEVSVGYRAGECEYYRVRDLADPAEAARGFAARLEYWRAAYVSPWGKLLRVERVV